MVNLADDMKTVLLCLQLNACEGDGSKLEIHPTHRCLRILRPQRPRFRDTITANLRVPGLALARVAQRTERQSVNQRVVSLIPSGHMPGLQARPPVEGAPEATTRLLMFLSLFLLPFPAA